MPAEPLLPDFLPPRGDAPETVQGLSHGKQHGDTSREIGTQPESASPAAEAEPETSDADLFAPSEARVLRPAADDVAASPPASDEQAVHGTPPADPAPEVVGTYVSGGNTYVMFSDGSIEAETPRGRFTFESLEELKAFVEAGGEGEARGVA